ncbi:MBL fold metallo-hydrolase [Alteribacillus iranensis]|uniref:Glyoxylase, beta-lactamase superfamily II n=1 Tax=Alteribacillus iranensis TaxID=930128 RepID=A0A1I1ZV04_9BACI|nr:MBL fold metallo-hydrolase [Alteribacillus iranensis]SFE35465.1 Glyoxylase, beta-lactamase superfamily II [Alteribacillus iranensis]
MSQHKPTELIDDIWISDGFDLHMPGRTGTYIINEEELAIIDTGPSLSVPYIKESIEFLGRDLTDVRYIIVTHVHLDHAGGAGLLIKDCPNAKVVVHPRGAKHLAHPERLIQGAKAVYGSQFDSFFAPVYPVDEDKIMTASHEETISLSKERTLTFLNTPGHANHHFSMVDSKSKGIFTGDTIGIQYYEGKRLGKEMYVPTTSPNHFDPDKMLESLSLLLSYKPTRIFFGHYGMTTHISEVKRQIESWIPIFMELGYEAYEKGEDHTFLATRIHRAVSNHYGIDHLTDDHLLHQIIQLDAHISAMGIIDYIRK